jgi:hypothetical protein
LNQEIHLPNLLERKVKLWMSPTESSEGADVFGRGFVDVWWVASQSIFAQNSYRLRVGAAQTVLVVSEVGMCFANVDSTLNSLLKFPSYACRKDSPVSFL